MALKAEPADQALLLDLQALDTRLAQIGHRTSKLPETAQLAELGTRRDAVQRQLAVRTGEWEDAKTELGRVEQDVAVVDARIARDTQRLQGSSSVKDIQGLEQELASLARRKSDLEDIELGVMETVEQREAALAATRDELTEIGATSETVTAARDAALGTLADDLRHAQADRGTVAGKVPEALLALYEKQRERYGIGASLLRGGASTASGVALNGNDMSRIRAAAPDDVLLCPDSSAILVRTEESGL
jgi:uncharacterized protein